MSVGRRWASRVARIVRFASVLVLYVGAPWVARAEPTARGSGDVLTPECSDGTDVAPGCGLLSVHVATEEFRETFRLRRCQDKTTDACELLYREAVEASLRERYWAADREAVAKKCSEEPKRCEDPIAFEKELLASHNAHLRAIAEKDASSAPELVRRSNGMYVGGAILTVAGAATMTVGALILVNGALAGLFCHCTPSASYTSGGIILGTGTGIFAVGLPLLLYGGKKVPVSPVIQAHGGGLVVAF